jgi:hypothetical protein
MRTCMMCRSHARECSMVSFSFLSFWRGKQEQRGMWLRCTSLFCLRRRHSVTSDEGGWLSHVLTCRVFESTRASVLAAGWLSTVPVPVKVGSAGRRGAGGVQNARRHHGRRMIQMKKLGVTADLLVAPASGRDTDPNARALFRERLIRKTRLQDSARRYMVNGILITMPPTWGMVILGCA